MFQHVPPAHSPLPLRSLLAAARELLHPSDAVSELEAQLKSDYRAGDVLLLDSGTQALTVAIRSALSARSTLREVALPAYSCYDVVTAAVGAGVEKFHFYDLDPHTLGPDPSSLEQILASGVRTAVLAPLFGVPLDWDALEEMAGRYGTLLIEDAAQGSGAEWRGDALGTLGDLSVLSFGRGKGWTGTRGGAALSRNRIPLERPSGLPTYKTELNTFLAAFAQSLFANPTFYSIPAAFPFLRLGETSYKPPTEPRGSGRLAARTLMASCQAARQEEEARRENARWLLTWVEDNAPNITRICSPRDGRCGFLRLPVLMSEGINSFADVGKAKRLGIAPGYPGILPELPALRQVTVPPSDDWSGARSLVENLVTLPTHSKMNRSGVVRTLSQACQTSYSVDVGL